MVNDDAGKREIKLRGRRLLAISFAKFILFLKIQKKRSLQNKNKQTQTQQTTLGQSSGIPAVG